jgi:hypothetical protein
MFSRQFPMMQQRHSKKSSTIAGCSLCVEGDTEQLIEIYFSEVSKSCEER